MTTIVLNGIGTQPLGENYTLDTAGLLGLVTIVDPTDTNTRAAAGLSEPALSAALQSASLHVTKLFELDITADLGAQTTVISDTSSTQAPPMTLRGPDLGSEVGQAILYSNEAGVLQWIFPDPLNDDLDGEGGLRSYQLPRASVSVDPDSPETAARGPLIKIGRRVVRVVLWASDILLEHGIQAMVGAWEEDKRAYGWQQLPFTNRELPDWGWMRSGRTLLLLHGTFSTAEQAFGGLLPETVSCLRQHYADRIVAFNHPSLSQSPYENVVRLLQTLPEGMELDLVTHSRGGLVGREFIRQAAQLQQGGRQVQVHKAVLVASPNRGTPLVNGDHMIEMLDRYTNLLAQAPDSTTTLALEGVMTLVKVAGHAALKALPGLQAMLPEGEYLRSLNLEPPYTVRYHALVADYRPTDSGWLARFCRHIGDKLVDGFFDEPNDGVVPTAGGYSSSRDGSGWSVPSAYRREFQARDSISHSTFFANPAVNDALLQWLTTDD
jgi:hypothetical protein